MLWWTWSADCFFWILVFIKTCKYQDFSVVFSVHAEFIDSKVHGMQSPARPEKPAASHLVDVQESLQTGMNFRINLYLMNSVVLSAQESTHPPPFQGWTLNMAHKVCLLLIFCAITHSSILVVQICWRWPAPRVKSWFFRFSNCLGLDGRTPQNSLENVSGRAVQMLYAFRQVWCCDCFPGEPVPQEKSNGLLGFSQSALSFNADLIMPSTALWPQEHYSASEQRHSWICGEIQNKGNLLFQREFWVIP